ncbi:hypothetical protein A3E17_00960 [Candidatus Amesbacteria bacterium RIFCSPHIGHO2_12_FULL_48_14]|uniref:PIN domain-containing protein n=3 Tax=Candidatus Amesiibacteriota TaxID=1752730 RepID=A0A1F4Z9W5_9BACT|nr:MAG: hypothetical protein UY22_C0025G0010 [Candidatus Amesbacteria bacterium GW2011_GWC1_48_10]KKU99048.1 MAG: hypothetical protein UY33_C0038G0007 [Candidatus Amesbacteria bacterium GW2011_GWA1_48_9]OGD03130.1 MAG: hypothetical protein A3E17_00960 [Candidatus Amesbacteria bacterium RIFCSPHIGHO2_12_FULL_48_14]
MNLVVDASVVLAVLLGEKENSKVVLTLAKAESLLSPMIIFYEVLNGLKYGVTRKRLIKEEAGEAWEKFRELGIEMIEQEGEAEAIFELACDRNISVYDAAYIVLAKKFKCQLLSLDKRLAELV